MAEINPAYRLTIFDSDGVTPLAPIGGAPHSDDFKVSTNTGETGFQPYLDLPQGRRGNFDPISRRLDTGRLTLRILDKRTGTANSDRWVTAFTGDADGASLPLGKKALVEESLDGGTTWDPTPFFTGVVHTSGLSGRNAFEIVLRDYADRLQDEVFFRMPAPSLSYIAPTPLLPIGTVEKYGSLPQSLPLKGSTSSWTFSGYGSGILVEIDLADETNLRTNILTRPLADIMTQEALALGSSLYFNPSVNLTSKKIRCRLEITSGARTGQSGDFYLERIPYTTTGWLIPIETYYARLFGLAFNGSKTAVASLGITEVDSSDPNYLAIPATGLDVEVYLVAADAAPSKDTPLLISDVDPLVFAADLLDGKFGALNDDGTAKRSYPYSASSIAAITRPLPKFRAFVTGTERIADILEDWICVPYNLGYRLDGSGEVFFFDLDLPASAAGIPTLTNSDLVEVGAAPQWETPLDSAITRIDATFYMERFVPVDEIIDSPERIPDYPALQLTEVKVPFIKIDIGNPDLGEQSLKIDAKGFRFATVEDPDLVATASAGLAKREEIVRDLDLLTEKLRAIYGNGVSVMQVAGRRESADVANAETGDLRIINVDEFPNPSSNVRGGARLTRVVSRQEAGLAIILGVMDLGSSAVANAPTIGALSLTSGAGAHSIDVPVTLNAQSERVLVETAVTSTAVGTRPGATSPLWKLGASVYASVTVSIPGHPSGSRVWVRAYTSPSELDVLKLPSAYVYPSGNDYVDTTSVGTPSSFVVTPSGNGGLATWTNSRDDLEIEVWLEQGGDDRRITKIPAGSTQFQYWGLEISTAYTGKIRYIDPFAGAGSFVSDAFTTLGTADVSPPLKGVSVVVGDTSG